MLKSDIMDVALFQDYLEERSPRKLASSSIELYRQILARFLVSDPDLENLDSYNNFLLLTTIKVRSNVAYSVLKRFIKFKIKDKSLAEKLIEGLIIPPERNDIKIERRYLDEDMMMEVINHLEYRKHKVIAIIQCLTGVRAGDIIRLKENAILPEVYEGGLVLRLNIVGKGDKKNVVFLHDPVAQTILLNYVTTAYSILDGYCFIEYVHPKMINFEALTEFRKMRMNYLAYIRDLKKALENSGINKTDFATHDFRRCFARRVWEKYKDVQALQSLLNHSNPRTTFRYLQQSGMKNIEYHREMQA